MYREILKLTAKDPIRIARLQIYIEQIANMVFQLAVAGAPTTVIEEMRKSLLAIIRAVKIEGGNISPETIDSVLQLGSIELIQNEICAMIFEKEAKNPDLQELPSTLDIEALLEEIEKDKTDDNQSQEN